VFIIRAGQTFKEFPTKDGRKAVLRNPRWDDLDDLLENFNSFVEEQSDEFCTTNEKWTREQMADDLGVILANHENTRSFSLVVEVDGKTIGISELTKKRGFSRHVGEISVLGIKKDYRNLGIGTEMLELLISQAERMRLKMLVLNTFSTNKRATHVYEKVGFKETGRTPKLFYKNGKYIDGVTMVKQLANLSC